VIDVPHDRPSGVLDHAEPAVPRTRVDSQDAQVASPQARDSSCAMVPSSISKFA